jgi:glycosyltransferase involved in cell wall biosynthesis
MINEIVSIIIPSFNSATFISETLDSILNQTYPYWEAIVVDDGSTDETCEIVKRFSENDERIQLFFRESRTKGASVCRNIGIEKAKGKYIIFLDSDDLLAPFCLQKRVFYFEKNLSLNFVVFQMACFNDKGIIDHLLLTKRRDNYLYSFLSHDLPWQITCPIWKTTFIRDQEIGFNIKYPRLQDPEFNTRVLLVNNVKFKVLFHSKPDCFYRTHSNKHFNVAILMTGFKMYIEEFLEKIKRRTDYSICRKHLKQCYIEAVRGYYTYFDIKFNHESTIKLKSLSNFGIKNKIIQIHTWSLTCILLLCYQLNFTKTKTGRYFLKAIVKLIKTI